MWSKGKVLTKVVSIASHVFSYSDRWCPFEQIILSSGLDIVLKTFANFVKTPIFLGNKSVFCTLANSATLWYHNTLRSYTDKQVLSSLQSN